MTRHRAEGFTLLEMLVGLMLVGFILVLLFAGLRLGSRSWEAGEAHIAAASERAVIEKFLRNLLEQAFPLHWSVDGESVLAFHGERQKLEFAAPMPFRDGSSVLQLVSLQLAQGETGQDLVVRWSPVNKQEPGFAAVDEAEAKSLARQVESVSIDYFGSEDTTTEPAWREQWTSNTVLPRLIRLHVAMANGDTWPDIVVAPKLGAAPVCVRWDQASGQCLE